MLLDIVVVGPVMPAMVGLVKGFTEVVGGSWRGVLGLVVHGGGHDDVLRTVTFVSSSSQVVRGAKRGF